MQGATSYNFNPRSRIGFDGIPSFHRGQSWDFNPRSRIGFDPAARSAGWLLSLFQSTKPYRLRQRKSRKPRTRQWFQSTKPYRLRLYKISYPTSPGNFNPRSRIGFDIVTYFRKRSTILFQSTKPYRLRRKRDYSKAHSISYFNPRSRIGFDSFTGYISSVTDISIHEAV